MSFLLIKQLTDWQTLLPNEWLNQRHVTETALARQQILWSTNSVIDINRRTDWQINQPTGWLSERLFEHRVRVSNCHASCDEVSHLDWEAKHSHRFCGCRKVPQIKPRIVVFSSLSNHPAIRWCTSLATVSLTTSLITYPTDNYRSKFHFHTTALRVFTSVHIQNNSIVMKSEIVHLFENSEYLSSSWYRNPKENYSLMNNRCRRLEAYKSSVAVQ